MLIFLAKSIGKIFQPALAGHFVYLSGDATTTAYQLTGTDFLLGLEPRPANAEI
jgi:hypothetical protein